jgi:FkbM family methyltransferase
MTTPTIPPALLVSDRVDHHPVFARFANGVGPVPNWIGVSTRREFFSSELEFVALSYPPIDEQYLEWVDLLEAVTRASGTFTMIEVGAGYGRWIVNAAAAVRSYSGVPCRLIAVEGEPTHFRWLKRHCRDNGVRAKLIHAAVDERRGHVEFAVGDAKGWYGQAIADGTWSPEVTTRVGAVTLSSLLGRLDRVDLVHMDIQGAEAKVVEEAAAVLDRVTRFHIGTHGREQEERLREVFAGAGWDPVNDYGAGTTCSTPWGPMTFQDGVQTWTNPRVT